MPKTLNFTREEAINALAKHELSCKETREFMLEALHSKYGWNGDLSLQVTYSWNQDLQEIAADPEPSIIFKTIVAEGLSDEFIVGNFSDVMDKKYDTILFECVKDGAVYHFWKNEELLEGIQSIGIRADEVIGDMKLIACPCCGANTLSERHGWDICPVCDWEDDGTDNKDASLYFSGPNKGLQLTAARIIFILADISNPHKTNSQDEETSIEKFIRSRFFEIDKEKGIICEKGTNWYAPLKPPHLKEDESLPKISLAGATMRDWPSTDD